jgi:hypothetical protein
LLGAGWEVVTLGCFLTHSLHLTFQSRHGIKPRIIVVLVLIHLLISVLRREDAEGGPTLVEDCTGWLVVLCAEEFIVIIGRRSGLIGGRIDSSQDLAIWW